MLHPSLVLAPRRRSPGTRVRARVSAVTAIFGTVLLCLVGGPASSQPPDLIGDGVFDCTRVGIAGNLPPGSEMQRLELDGAAFPDALCNDGSQPILYFRPFVGAANENRWVIQLQGGGSCKTPQACADRWCSVGTGFSARQMSTDFEAHEFIDGQGLMDRRPLNPVGGWNHVFLRYCSSDSWSGTETNAVVQAEHPLDLTPETFRIHFLGRRILEAAIDTMRHDGVAPPEYTLPNEVPIEMPDLDAAEIVLFAGASAGGNGVMHNVDLLRDVLEANSTNCSGAVCGPEFRALIDSSFEPSLEGLDLSLTSECIDDGACDWESYLALDTSFGLWQAQSDESCQAYHDPIANDDPWKCEDESHVLRHHVTTPMFVRMGQEDQLISAAFHQSGLAVPPAVPFTLPVFAERIRTELAELSTIQATAEEGALITVVPGVFGPVCPEHETLRSNPDVFNTTIVKNGVPYAMFDVMTNWLTGSAPSSVINQPGDEEFCPGAVPVPSLGLPALVCLVFALVIAGRRAKPGRGATAHSS